MDFINKNFAYKSLPFNEFVRRAAAVEDLEKFFISKVINITDTLPQEQGGKILQNVQLTFIEETRTFKVMMFRR